MSYWGRLFLAVSISSIVLAQSEVGGASLNGTVTDPSGAVIAGAKLTATNAGTGLLRTVETSDAGLYNFGRLPVGTYNVTIEAKGFKTAQRTGIVLNIGAVLTFDMKLEVGGTQETVSVSAEVPVIETARSQTSTAVDAKAVRDLPINGRNFLDFVTLTPGVTRDPRGGDLSFGGQRGTSNSLLVDGGDSNNAFFGQSAGRAGTRNPYTFSQEAVQEFQVNTSGYAAETGRAGAGVVNVVTKSGTNDFHGNLYWFFRDKAMNANTFFNNSRGIVKQPYHFNQYGANLGGPVVLPGAFNGKNKLFFFYNYEAQRNTLPNPVFYPIAVPSDAASQQAAAELRQYQTPYTTGFDNTIHTVRIDYNISQTQFFNVRYNNHRFDGKNFENAGNQSASERTGNSSNYTDNVAVQYTKTIGTSMVYDARFIYLRDDAPGAANSDKPEAQIRQSGTLMIAIGRNSFSPRYTNIKKYNTIHAVSMNRGKHSYKMGVDLNFERIANFFPGNFSGSYTFDTLADWVAKRASAYTQGFAGAGTNGATTYPNANEIAFFAQDSWRVTDRLTLNYGVRYDLFSYEQPPFSNPDPDLAALKLNTGRINKDTNNWAGRAGFAYRLGSGGKQVIRGGYGMYYGRTASILIGTSHSQNGVQVQTYSLSRANASQAALIPTYPAVLSAPPGLARTPDIYVVAPDYVQPLTHQLSFNYELQLGRDYALTFGYLGVRGMHLSRTRDINHFPLAAETARFVDGSNITIYRRPNVRPYSRFGRISLFDSGGDSIYHGGFVQVQKRFAQNFQLLANYTFSKVIDTLPDQTSVVPGNAGDDAKVAFDTLRPNADRAVGDTNIPHRFVGSGVWDINYFKGTNPVVKSIAGGWQLSAILSAQSGRWLTARSNVDLNNDGNRYSDRSPGFGRNTIEGPGFASLDVRVSKDIFLWTERVKVRLIGEAFNALNRANFSAIQQTPYNYNATTREFTAVSNFKAPTATFDPRILQIAARFSF
ncbi:MAG: TonB-dependent receptor [Acidobacteria bacterium]|nr:TonB-dependent receptor [Acidobacteriota bacterium]